jgi:hypothetical protein
LERGEVIVMHVKPAKRRWTRAVGCREDASPYGVTADAAGVGLVVGIFGNILQAKDRGQLQQEVERLWKESARLRAALGDWQAEYSRIEASLRFVSGQHDLLMDRLEQVRRQRDDALARNQELLRQKDRLADEVRCLRQDKGAR